VADVDRDVVADVQRVENRLAILEQSTWHQRGSV
jgi:hypothetical protein